MASGVWAGPTCPQEARWRSPFVVRVHPPDLTTILFFLTGYNSVRHWHEQHQLPKTPFIQCFCIASGSEKNFSFQGCKYNSLAIHIYSFIWKSRISLQTPKFLGKELPKFHIFPCLDCFLRKLFEKVYRIACLRVSLMPMEIFILPNFDQFKRKTNKQKKKPFFS